ncbi:hypothetical protein BaRGS_00017984, partial [Batillaria attramentaria]
SLSAFASVVTLAICGSHLDWFTTGGQLYGVTSQNATFDAARACCSCVGDNIRLAAFTSNENVEDIASDLDAHRQGGQYWVNVTRSEANEFQPQTFAINDLKAILEVKSVK